MRCNLAVIILRVLRASIGQVTWQRLLVYCTLGSLTELLVPVGPWLRTLVAVRLIKSSWSEIIYLPLNPCCYQLFL